MKKDMYVEIIMVIYFYRYLINLYISYVIIDLLSLYSFTSGFATTQVVVFLFVIAVGT